MLKTAPISYQEITFATIGEDVDTWAESLLLRGALSVTVQDGYANTKNEHALFDELGNISCSKINWPRSHLSVLFSNNLDARSLITSIAADLSIEPPNVISHQEIADQNWIKLTQSQFMPIEVGQKIVIAPSWSKIDDTNIRPLKIILDPGLAFGTGSHPTTQLCIEWLELNIKANHTVLDYGCGSGILSIVADFCEAKNVLGLDIDQEAINAAQNNSKLNKRDIKFLHVDQCPNQKFDILISNILSSPLKVLAPLLCNKINKDGLLTLSGILEEQMDEVILAYKPFIQLDLWKKKDQWVLLSGQKRSN